MPPVYMTVILENWYHFTGVLSELLRWFIQKKLHRHNIILFAQTTKQQELPTRNPEKKER